MAPRGRPRKMRNTRMDAAIDAMKQFGFSEELIRAKVKELLSEYGGDDGWVFIEDCAYKVLLEVCLEANNEEKNAEEGNLLQDIQITTHTTHLQIVDQISSQEATNAVSNSEGNSLAVSLPEKIPDVSYPLVIPSLPPANSHPKRRPCYGWIDSDEDEEEINDFILLPPAPRLTPPASGQSQRMDGGINKKTKRKSRWDLKPGDP